MFYVLILTKQYFVVFRWLDVRFVSRPVEIVIFRLTNGETPKWVVDFLRVKDTFRKNMEIVEGSSKNYNNNNNSKPWKSLWIVRVKPNTLEIFEDFAFYLFCFHVFFIFKNCSFFLFLSSFCIFSIFSILIYFIFRFVKFLFFFVIFLFFVLFFLSLLTDVFYTNLNSLSLVPRHRCASVVTLMRTDTAESAEVGGRCSHAAHSRTETQKESVMLSMVGLSETFVIR